MSDYQPKVGDQVMVGEHGPYEVVRRSAPNGYMATLRVSGLNACVPAAWLTPAPEPGPDEPTAPGALVRAGDGDLFFHSTGGHWYRVTAPNGYWEWDEIARPVTVVLADPAEVEQLRAQLAMNEDLRGAS